MNTPGDFRRFNALVDGVLSLPKGEVNRVKNAPWTEEQKDRVLGHLRDEIEREERDKSQVIK